MDTFSSRTAGLLALAIALSSVSAPSPAASPAPPDPTRDPVMLTAGFLNSHPDLRFRLLGLEKFREGEHEQALGYFQRASYYADKPSQGMVAEMLWDGRGVARDPALAYVWMDLAAERGYEGFLALRERYWAALDPAQRARAIEEGQALYARYGDEAAQPRMATLLRRERLKMTGSHLGNPGNLRIIVPGPTDDTSTSIDGSKFYDERYWNPAKYQAWHDSIWMKPRIGKVSVGALETVDAASRIPATAPQVDAPEPVTGDGE